MASRDATERSLKPASAGLARASLASVGVAVPERVVENAVISERLGVEADWIETRTGVSSRHEASEDESLTDLAAKAARDALERAGVAAGDVDLVLVATTSADELLPNAAPQVAAAIGVPAAGAMDVGAACSGFITALSLGASYVESHRARCVLVVGADLMRRLTDHDDRSTAALFGDGAGAAVITADDERGGMLGPAIIGSDAPVGAELIYATHENRLVRMNGRDTYRNAVARLSESSLEAVAAAGLELDDIDLFVYHQANARILRAVGEKLGLDAERVVDCIGEYGNTSAATVPIALRTAEDDGRLKPGDRVLLGAFGAGFIWAAMVLEIGGAPTDA